MFYCFLASILKLDLGFLFGADGSNSQKDFDTEKKIATEMLNNFVISSSNTRVGIIQYGRDPRVVERLDSYTDKKTLTYIIGLLNPTEGHRIDKALDLVRTNLFDERYGARRGIPKTVIVFTNKKSDVSPKDAARKLRDLGVKTIAIGVGEKVDKGELKDITGNDKGLFVATGPEDKNIVKDAAKALLPGMLMFLVSRVQIFWIY